MNVTIFPLGAGQQVGRSCIFLKYPQGPSVLLDIGLHMGRKNAQQWPNLDLLLKKYNTEDINKIIDIVLISHFHLDHCGALPLLIIKYNYRGIVLTSHPSRCIIPYMLFDFQKVSKNNKYKYRPNQIWQCVKSLKSIDLRESFVHKNMRVTAFYAGHVLGAVMFCVEFKGVKVVYTGDFSSVADRHLKGAQIDPIRPQILISESTYGIINRMWKKSREIMFMKNIEKTFKRGGKVLIPVFSLGRAQEMFALIEDIWAKHG